jgi:hypothetical protein
LRLFFKDTGKKWYGKALLGELGLFKEVLEGDFSHVKFSLPPILGGIMDKRGGLGA